MLKRLFDSLWAGKDKSIEQVAVKKEDPLEIERRRPFSASPFVVEYIKNGGETQTYGVRSNTAEVLESFVGGLEADKAQTGVPLLAYYSTHRQWILAWARQDYKMRNGAWKTWGVSLTGNSERYRQYWPLLWQELCKEPKEDPEQSLNVLTCDMQNIGVNHLPEMPENLKTILAKAYLSRFKENKKNLLFTVDEDDFRSVISWIWLLGPLDPSKCGLTAIRSAFYSIGIDSYGPIWRGESTQKHDVMPESADRELFEKYFEDILQIAKTDLLGALAQIKTLRLLPNYDTLRTAVRVGSTLKG